MDKLIIYDGTSHTHVTSTVCNACNASNYNIVAYQTEYRVHCVASCTFLHSSFYMLFANHYSKVSN